MVRKPGELPKFLVFNSRTESIGNSYVFSFYLLPFALYSSCISFLELFMLRISDVFVVVFSDKHGQLPPLLPHRGREALFQGPAPPGVPQSAIRRTPLSLLQQRCSDLLLPAVHGPRCDSV
jgi:hypothetical protein